MPSYEGDPLCCPKCGQSGAERPGLRLERGLPEAVFVGEEGFPTETITCNACGHRWLIPAGSVRVIKP
jgi:predicted nucleic-acid-binding Zn-ribbon protein